MGSDRAYLLDALADLTANYTVVQLKPDHIDRWLRQFDGPDGQEEEILDELLHVLNQTYYSESLMDRLVERMITEPPALQGEGPQVFWPSIVLVHRCYGSGNSQKILIRKLSENWDGLRLLPPDTVNHRATGMFAWMTSSSPATKQKESSVIG